MIGRTAKLQVLAFIVVSVLGVAFVGFRYVGFGDHGYLVHADFVRAGGIYANAAVTYRGVPVGKVEKVALHGDAVRADLRIERGTLVPTALRAVVAQRSAVGEQYVDLRPETEGGPYLADGDVIARERTGTPLPVENLLTNLDALVRSVNPEDLTVVIDQLGVAFEGSETALRRLLDAMDLLLNDASRNLPQTVALIRDGQTVLATQQQSSEAIRRWAAGLAQLTTTLRESDPDLRRLLANTPPAAKEVIGLLRDVDSSLGPLLGNLITVNGVAVRRLAGIEQILIEYPLVVAGGFTVAPGDGTAHLGLVLNLSDPPSCNYQQTGTRQRCTQGEQSHGSGVRSTNNAPRPGGGDPSPAQLPPPGPDRGDARPEASSGPAAGSYVAGYDPVTGLVTGPDGLPLQFGGTGGQYRLAGEQSWKQLLLAGLAP